MIGFCLRHTPLGLHNLRSISRRFLARVVNTGIAVTPQILRNTSCKKLAGADVPLQLLAKMIGVKPEATRVYYAQPAAGPEDLLAAAEKVTIKQESI